MAKKTGPASRKKRRQKHSLFRRTAPLGAAIVLLVILLFLLGSGLQRINDTAQALSPSAEYSSFSDIPPQHGSGTAESSGDDPSFADAAGDTGTDTPGDGGDDPGSNVSGDKADDAEKTASETAGSPEEDWRLILVNRWNPMPEDYDVELTQLANGHAVDSRIYPDLQQMFDDARAEGLMPTISSSYRTADKQQQILDDKLAAYENEGNSYEDAKELAEAWVAVPGTSEHQLGIAVDITSADREAQAPDVIWEWLKTHCCEYGFIVRYPEEKSDITGVINEPWHFRYVGKEAAKEIMEQGICLEEYLGRTEH